MDLKIIESLFLKIRKNQIYFPRIENFRKVYEDMSVHVNGVFPTRLIESRRPKEDDERYNFRKANYEPITKGIMREAINSLYRIFNEQNYDIKASEDTEKYIRGTNFEGLSFMQFIQSHVLYQMILDPNGLLLVVPDGQGLTDKYKPVEPKIKIVRSIDIKYYDDDLLICSAPEKSWVMHYGGFVPAGDIYYIATREYIFTYEQVGKLSGNNFEARKVYYHGIGKIPACVLGGEWNNELGCFESYFNAFVPFANEAIRQYSDWQGAMVTSAYPVRVVKPVTCNYVDYSGRRCHNGFLDDESLCPSCKGSGYVVPSSPYGVYIKDDSGDGIGKKDDSPPLEFISPKTDILDYSHRAWNDLLNRAKETLHLDKINESQSGPAKAIDREREYSMILKISNNLFDNIINKCLNYIEKYINIINPVEVQIIKPREFSLKTEQDLVQDLAALKETGASMHLLKDVICELIKKRYTGNKDIYLKHRFLMEYDVLYPFSMYEKINLQAAGLIDKKTVLKSIYSSYFLDEMLTTTPLTNKNFKYFQESIDEKFEKVFNENLAIDIFFESLNGKDESSNNDDGVKKAEVNIPYLGAPLKEGTMELSKTEHMPKVENFEKKTRKNKKNII